MKTTRQGKSPLRVSQQIIAVSLVAGLFLSGERRGEAASVATAGSHNNVLDAWGSTNTPKPLDADGNDAFGSDGYYFFNPGTGGNAAGAANANMKFSTPAYVTGQGFGAGMDSFHCICYQPIDDPDLVPAGTVANVTAGQLRYSAQFNGNPQGVGLGDLIEMFSVTLGAGIPASGFRVGIMTDTNESPHIINPPSIQIGVNGSSATHTGIELDSVANPDFHFFDVTGAAAGDVLTVFGEWSPAPSGPAAFDGNTMIGGVTFDSITAAPPTAGVVTVAGVHTNVQDAWASTNVAKPLDADLNDAYGSDGYYFFNVGGVFGADPPGTDMLFTTPSYVASQAFGEETDSFGIGSYAPIDDPNQAPGADVPDTISGVLRYNAVPDPQGALAGNLIEMFSVTLGSDIPATGFRMGIMTDNNDIPDALNPPAIHVEVNGVLTTFTGVEADETNDPDIYFFDVIGANPGDVVKILVSPSPAPYQGNTMIGGVTFDTIIPEPSTFLLAAIGLLSVALSGARRRRRVG